MTGNAIEAACQTPAQQALIDALTARCNVLQIAHQEQNANADRLRRLLADYGRLLDASAVTLDLVVSANEALTGDTHCKSLLGKIAALRGALSPVLITKETTA